MGADKTFDFSVGQCLVSQTGAGRDVGHGKTPAKRPRCSDVLSILFPLLVIVNNSNYALRHI